MEFLNVDAHISLQLYHTNDAQAFFELLHKNKAHLRPWINWVDAINSLQDAQQLISARIKSFEEQESISLFIVQDQKIIGSIGMFNWRKEIKCAEVGYWMDKDFENKGILSKALNVLISYLFQQVQLNKIELQFNALNKASGAIAKKFNFKIEGIIRSNYAINGTLEDSVLAGLLYAEWKQMKTT
jgi:ribosomal-protein-serine acetyltransferase